MSANIIETEECLIIETPERVELEFALASIGNRFLAVVVDHLIQYFTIFSVAWFFLAISGVNSQGTAKALVDELPNWTLALMIIVVFLLFTGYFVFWEWIWNGQTPGKRLMKLRVIREDGRPITFWEALARNLLRIFDAMPGFVIPIYSVGLIAVFMNRRDQRVGDIFAGTVVIRERSDEAPTFAETFSTSVSDGAFQRVQKKTEFQGNIALITESEMDVVKTFLRRRWDLTERQRIWMAWRVALPLMYKMKPAYDAATFTYEGFLEEVVHRFHANRRFIN